MNEEGFARLIERLGDHILKQQHGVNRDAAFAMAREIAPFIKGELENFHCWRSGNDGASVAEVEGLVHEYLESQVPF